MVRNSYVDARSQPMAISQHLPHSTAQRNNDNDPAYAQGGKKGGGMDPFCIAGVVCGRSR